VTVGCSPLRRRRCDKTRKLARPPVRPSFPRPLRRGSRINRTVAVAGTIVDRIPARINDPSSQLGSPHMRLGQLLGRAATKPTKVATFYHHLNVVEGKPMESLPAPPADGARCRRFELLNGGAKALREKLPALLGREVRVIPALGRAL